MRVKAGVEFQHLRQEHREQAGEQKTHASSEAAQADGERHAVAQEHREQVGEQKMNASSEVAQADGSRHAVAQEHREQVGEQSMHASSEAAQADGSRHAVAEGWHSKHQENCHEFFLWDGRPAVELPSTWLEAREDFAEICTEEELSDDSQACANLTKHIFKDAPADGSAFQPAPALCQRLWQATVQADGMPSFVARRVRTKKGGRGGGYSGGGARGGSGVRPCCLWAFSLWFLVAPSSWSFSS